MQSTFAFIDQRPNPNGIKSFPYLYGVEGDANASFPVLDHLAIAHRGCPEVSLNRYVEDLPDFLFADTGTYRVVEFYVHWCDICKIFKPHYMELGRRIQLMAGPNVTIDVHAVSCSQIRPLCRKLAVDTYPHFRIFQPGDTIGVDVPHVQVNPTTILQKMTYGVVDFNWVAVFAELGLKTGDVAQTLRNNVNIFFSCEACRRNLFSPLMPVIQSIQSV